MSKTGAKPPLVVMIDTSYLTGLKAGESWKDQLRRYRYHLDRAVRSAAGVRHLAERLRSRFFRLIHKVSTSVGVEMPRIASDVFGRQLLAAENYRAKRYSGPVWLFKAETRPEFLSGGAGLGWGQILPNLRVEDVPGDHGTINTGVNSKILARKLMAVLEASQKSQDAAAESRLTAESAQHSSPLEHRVRVLR